MDTQVKVGVVVVNADGKVLLIKEKLAKKPVALWNIIKGSYETGETIGGAAVRECLEETGLNVELEVSLGVYISEENEKVRVQCNFLAYADQTLAVLAGANEQAMRGEAIEEVRWFTRDEIQDISPEEFVSPRAYEVLRDWMSGQTFSLAACRQVQLTKL
jgi:ADP-ribose pyrophosphatase YjhB (NUDIX family)